MSRFARIGEEAISRQTELTGEEFRLYVLIVFHTFMDSEICNKSLHELSGLYGLIYNHTTERYKKLRLKTWCENTKKGIHPLVGLKTPKIGVLEGEKLQKSELSDSLKLQKSESATPKIGVLEGEKLQKSELHIRNIEPFKEQIFQDSTATKIVATTTGEKNGHLSKFSREEILRYLEVRIRGGEDIPTPHKLANWMYQTGEYDVFIRATLYPEQPEPAAGSVPAENSLSGEILEALEILTDMLDSGEDISDMRQWYRAELWEYLMKELEKR